MNESVVVEVPEAEAIEKPLSEKHQKFVYEFMVDLNATQAYLRTYPDCTIDSARAAASLLLTNHNVQDAIAREREETSRRCQITADDVYKTVRGMMMTNTDDLFDEDADGYLIPKRLSELSEGAKIAVAEVTQVTTQRGEDFTLTIQRFKTHDKVKATDMAAKLLDLYPKNNKVELTGKDGIPLQATVNYHIKDPGKQG